MYEIQIDFGQGENVLFFEQKITKYISFIVSISPPDKALQWQKMQEGFNQGIACESPWLVGTPT